MKVGELVMVKKFVAFVGVVILLMQLAVPAFAAGAGPLSDDSIIDVSPLAFVSTATSTDLVMLTNTEAAVEAGGYTYDAANPGGIFYAFLPFGADDPASEVASYELEVRSSTATDDGMNIIATVKSIATETDTVTGKVIGAFSRADMIDPNTMVSVANNIALVALDYFVRVRAIASDATTGAWSDFASAVYAPHGKLPTPEVTLEAVENGLKLAIATPTDDFKSALAACGVTTNASNEVEYEIKVYNASNGDVLAIEEELAYVDGPVVKEYSYSPGGDLEAGEQYYAKVRLIPKTSEIDYGPSDVDQTETVTAPYIQGYTIQSTEDYYKYVKNGQTATLTDLFKVEKDGADVTASFDLSFGVRAGEGTVEAGVWTVGAGDAFEMTVTATPNIDNVEGFSRSFLFYAASLGFDKAAYELDLLENFELALADEVVPAASQAAEYAPDDYTWTLQDGIDGVTLANGVLKVTNDTANTVGDTFDVTVADANNANITKTITVTFIAPTITSITWADEATPVVLKLTSSTTDLYYDKPVAELYSSVQPNAANPAEDIEWAIVGDEGIVKLENGVLTGLKAGHVKLTARVKRGTLATEEALKTYQVYVSAEATAVAIKPTTASLMVNGTVVLQPDKAEDMGVFDPVFTENPESDAFTLSNTGGLRAIGAVGSELTVRLTYKYIDFSDGNLKTTTAAGGPYKIVGVPPTKVVLPKTFNIIYYNRSLTNPESTVTDITYDLVVGLEPLGADTNKVEVVSWQSSKPDVIAVPADPKTMDNALVLPLRPLQPGSTKITLTYKLNGGAAKTISTTVNVAAGADSTTIQKADSYVATEAKPYADLLSIGKTITFKATVLNGFTNKNAANTAVTWASSNEWVASIDAKGKLTANNPGTVQVRTTSQDAGRVSPPVTIEVVQPLTSFTVYTPDKVVELGKPAVFSPILHPHIAYEKVEVSERVKNIEWTVTQAPSKLLKQKFTDGLSGPVFTSTDTDLIGKKATVQGKEPYTGKTVKYTITVVAPGTISTSTDISYKDVDASKPFTLNAGKSKKLADLIVFNDGKGGKVDPKKDKYSTQIRWTTIDPTAVSIDKNGTIKALNDWDGQPVLVAAELYRPETSSYGDLPGDAPGKTYVLTWLVTVNKPITSVAVVPAGSTKASKTFTLSNLGHMNDGQARDVELLIKPAGATIKGISWTGTDTDIVTIDNDPATVANPYDSTLATIAYVGAGKITPTVTVATTNASGAAATRSAKITVNAKHYAVNTLIKDEAFASTAYQGENIVAVKKSIKLAVSFDPVVTEKTGIQWSSDTPSIAKVNAGNGTVTGVAPGSTTIRARVAGGAEVTYNVKVLTAADANALGASASLKLLQKSFKVPAATATDFVLNAVLTPAGRESDLGWTISDTTVVDFKDSGITTGADVKFTVKPVGNNKKATITVRDRISGKTASVTVTTASSYKKVTGLTLNLPKNNNKRKDGATDPITTFYVGRAVKVGAAFTPKKPTNTQLEWSVTYYANEGAAGVVGGAGYATVDNLGNVKPLMATPDGAYITVNAAVQEGANTVSASTANIKIFQLAEGIKITGRATDTDYYNFSSTQGVGYGSGVGDEKIYLDAVHVGTPPTKPIASHTDVTWASKNKKVVDIGTDNNGVYLIKKNAVNKAGSTTITATSKDGGNVVGTFYVNTLGKDDKDNPAYPKSITVTQGKQTFAADGTFYVNPGKAYKFTGKAYGTDNANGKKTNASPSGIIWEIKGAIGAPTLKTSTLTVPADTTVTLVARSVADRDVKREITVTSKAPIAKVQATQSTVAVPFNGEVLVSARINKLTPDMDSDSLEWSVAAKDATKFGVTFETLNGTYNAALGVYQNKIMVDNVAKEASSKGIKVTAKNTYSGKSDTFSLVIYNPEATGKSIFVPVTGIGVNKSSVILAPGKSTKLAATFIPANATNKGVTWLAMQMPNAANEMTTPSALVTSNPAVFSVDKSGNVTMGNAALDGYYYAVAVAAGSQTATLADNDLGAKYAISEVRTGFSVTKIALPKTVEPFAPNFVVGVTFTPADALNKDVVWTSSNHNIIAPDDINKEGESGAYRFTPRGKGKVTLTATSVDGNKKASMTVIVKNIIE